MQTQLPEAGPGPDHTGTGIDIPKAELDSLGKLGSQAAARGRPADQPTPRADNGTAEDAQALGKLDVLTDTSVAIDEDAVADRWSQPR